MIRWILIFAISLTPAVGSAQEAAPPQHPDAATLGLELTIAISNERFCSGDADVYTEAFDLTARYTNTGTNKLIVFTGTDVPAKVLVSKTAEDLRAGRNEVEQNGDFYPMDGGRYMLGSNPKDERAVHLQPARTALSRSTTGALVRKVDSAKIDGTIGRRTHFLQVQMLVKVSNDDTASQTPPSERRGRRPSFHWVSVSSEPIEFEVPASPTLQDCAK